MKNDIIVATDLSVASKSGLRFAIQLASQYSFRLVFFHVIELLIPSAWNDAKAKIRMDQEIADAQTALETFVKSVYRETKLRQGKFECVVRYGSPVDRAIVRYAIERKAGFICMSTRGAGVVRKIIGTISSTVIRLSPVPTFVVPKTYRLAPIGHIMYSSDLTDFDYELKQINIFALMIKARLTVLHYDYIIRLEEGKSTFEKVERRYASSHIKFALRRFAFEETFVQDLDKAIRQYKPSIITLFTKQDRRWYERVFLASKSAEVSFKTKKPILVFPKRKS